MAVYDPPQAMWKRNLAGILDFVLAATVFGILLYQFFPKTMQVTAQNAGVKEVFGLGPWASLGLLALVVAYFIVLGRTGGSVFQRLFGMKRARST
jgi:CDP-diglyceride synthetase